MAKTSAPVAKQELQDELSELIASDLNKKFKDTSKVAYIGMEDTPADLTWFVSTGCTLLDLAISNKPNGGIAFGRICHLTGLEQSSKSLLAAHMMVNVQKINGIAILIDTENAVNWEFFKAIGLNRNKNFVYASIETVEEIFEAVESIIETVRKTDKDKPVIIVVDSMAGATTKIESESGYDRDGYATSKAIILSKAMRKITNMIGKQKIALVITNQLRHKMDAMAFGEKYTVAGGKSLDFHSSTTIRLKKVGDIKDANKRVVGAKVEAKTTKNRLGPPLRVTSFNIYFDRGIDDTGSTLEYLREQGIIKGAKSNALSYTNNADKEFAFSEKTFQKFLDDNPVEKDEIYTKTCDDMVRSYRTDGKTVEDFNIEENIEE